MTIAFVTTPVSLTANTLAKSSDVNTNFSSVQANFTYAGTSIQRAFKTPLAENGTDMEMTQLVATRASKSVFFDALGNLTGTAVALSAFDYGGFAITGLPSPVAASSPVTLGYLSSYSSSLAGLPPVSGQAGRLLTNDGTVAQWTNSTTALTVGTMTATTLTGGTVNCTGGLNFTSLSGFSISANIGNTFPGIIWNGSDYISFNTTTKTTTFVANGGFQALIGAVAGATKYPILQGGNAGNAQVSASSGNLELSSGAIFTGGGVPIADSIAQYVKCWTSGGQPTISFIDAARTANNRNAEIGFTGGQVVYRFVNDAYNVVSNYLVVTGGSAAVSSIAFSGPLTNTSTIGFTSEFNAGNSGAALTLNLSAGNNQRLTLTANTTLTVGTGPSVAHFNFKIIQDATGGRTITWSGLAATNCPGGVFPTIATAANGVTFLTLYWDGSVLWCKGSQPMI